MSKQLSRLWDLLQRNIPWVVLVIVCAGFSLITDNFFSLRNILNILNQNAYVIIAALGITPIMMSGQTDLSGGQQMAILGVVSGIMLTRTAMPVPLIFVATILIGIALNFMNAIIAFKLDLSLFIVSLATMNIFMGTSYTISGAGVINFLPESFKFLGQGFIGPVPFPVILAGVFFLIMNFFLTRTYWGRYIYALGGNTEAARLAGINVLGVRMMIAAICGFFLALSSLMLIARLGLAQSTAGPGTEFTVITAVLVGGVSLRGGEGKLHCVLAGVFIMAVFANGMQLANMGVYTQYIAKGIIMILAIAFDAFQYKRRQKLKGNRREVA